MDIANLIIRVTNDGLTAAQRELRRLRDEAGRAQTANERFGDSIAGLNKIAMVGMGALGATMAGSIKTAMSFESAMAEVNKTVDFAAKDGLANLRGELEQLTKTIPLTFEELAAVTATGGQLGIAEDNLAHFTEVMAKMGVAFDIPAQQAADSMAKIANVFQIPIENIDRLGDAINTLSNNTPATAAQLIDSLQRVGGVAKVFGLSEDATLGLTGALIAMGKPAEVASSAVNSLLTSFSTLDNATKSQLIGFEQLGLNIDEFSELVATDGKQAIITYLDAINDLDKSQRIGTNALILGKEFGDDITMLAGSVGVLENNWEMLGETVGTTKEYFGSMESEFAKMSDTTANKMELVKNNIRLVAASVGDAFLPAVNELLASLVPVIEKMTVWAKANPELIVTIAKVTAGVLGAVIAMATISGAIGTVMTAFSGLSAIFTAVKVAIIALSGPIGLAAIALGILVTAGALVYQNWDMIKAKAYEIWGAVTGRINTAIATMKAAFDRWVSNTSGAITNVKNTIIDTLKSLPGRVLQVGKDIVQGLINGIKSGVSGVTTAIGDMASSAISKAKSVLDIRSPSRKMKKVGEQTAEGMAVGIKKGAKAVKTEAQRMAEQAISATKNSIASLQKEIALFGNDSAIASFDYDRNAGSFKGVPDSLLDQERKLIIQKQTLIDLDKRQIESAKALATAREAIQARFDKMSEYKDSTKTNLQGMLSGIEDEDPLTRLQNQYEERMSIIEKYEQMHTDMLGVQSEARLAVEQSYMNAKRDLMLDQGEALFGNLAGLSKTFLGEQSAMYRSLFAIEKGYTLAKVLLKNKEAIAAAWASAPFPANLGAVASTVAGTAGLASAVSGIVPGFKQGGYTGNMGSSQVAGVVHGQEYVFDAASTKRIGVDNLNAMRSGKAANDGGDNVNVNVNVTVNSDGSSNVESNKQMGRSMGNALIATIQQQLIKEKRQGGLLYGA